MINITICDDEAVEVEYLKSIVTAWAKENNEIATFLLDVQMGEMSGIELAKHIRKINSSTQIIFITGFADYMQLGYEVEALHYIMKPIEKSRLFDLLTKATKRLSKNDEVILVQTKDGSLCIKQRDIYHIEAFAHYVVISTTNGEVETRAKISELEVLLKEGFVRCHRSYIAGIRHIERISKTEVTMADGRIIPISRRSYNEVNRAFIELHTAGGKV